MTEKNQYRRQPVNIARGMRSRIRQIAAAREMLALEVVSEEFWHCNALALEHLQFLQADLQAELDQFCAKYNIEANQVPARGMR